MLKNVSVQVDRAGSGRSKVEKKRLHPAQVPESELARDTQVQKQKRYYWSRRGRVGSEADREQGQLRKWLQTK